MNQRVKALVYRSSEPCCKNDQRYPIRSQWGIAEAELSIRFRHGERSILGSDPSTIRLTGIAYQMEETEETADRHGEDSSSYRCTYQSRSTINDEETYDDIDWTDQNSLLWQLLAPSD
jgi:hypothetical protein